MMSAPLVTLVLCLAQAPQAVDKTSLEFYQGTFVARTGEKALRVPLEPETPKPLMSRAFRRDQLWAVWDERGLTIRTPSRVSSTHLEDIAVSPKIFERDEIRDNLRLFASGARSKEASSLAGSQRVGKYAYFLPRWVDKKGKPWLEALIRVDMGASNPKPEFLGRFTGLSAATEMIDDRLVVTAKGLGIVSNDDRRWGLATYNIDKDDFDFQPVGDILVSITPSGKYVEKTSYGAYSAGWVDLNKLERHPVRESRAALSFLDEETPAILVGRDTTSTTLYNADTGALVKLPAGTIVRRAEGKIFTWDSATDPKSATLFDPARWAVLARWKA